MKRLVILGSTGSIGKNAVAVASSLPGRFKVSALAAHSNVELLAKQAAETGAEYAIVADESKYALLASLLPKTCVPLAGKKAMEEIAGSPETDIVLCSIVGTGGLTPSLAALKSGKRLALASKEVMVMAGELTCAAAKTGKGEIIPVDSEHSAIFQCLQHGGRTSLKRLILTASGGPFRKFTQEMLEKATLQQALKHPTWSMGVKVTLDSATLMNKALEMVEAGCLFNVGEEKIDVLVHPQSAVHSLVEFSDGAILAQLGVPDMRLPIQYALTHPDRTDSGLQRLDLAKTGTLSFEEPDATRFPSINIARAAMRAGGTMPCAMNAANETAVEKFRRGEIRFTDIWKIIERTLERHENLAADSLENIMEADAAARRAASEKL